MSQLHLEVTLWPHWCLSGTGTAGYDRTSAEVRKAAHAHAHDDRLREAGAVMGIAGLTLQVRNNEASGVVTTDGAFLKPTLRVAGFAVIEATSIEEAVDLAARTPCAVAYGVVEVWPLNP